MCASARGDGGGGTAPQDRSRASSPLRALIPPDPHPCINAGLSGSCAQGLASLAQNPGAYPYSIKIGGFSLNEMGK